MADDNQNSEDHQLDGILWGLTFGAASAIAFKIIGALFPGRTAKTDENKKEKVTQVIIPAININVPPNLSEQVKFQHNASANPVAPASKADDTSRNSQTTSATTPKATSRNLSCGELIDLFTDCKESWHEKRCDSYAKIMKKFCNGSVTAAAGPSPSDIGSTLLLGSAFGCLNKLRHSSSDRDKIACLEKYSKLVQMTR